jgi:phage terminase small subunit
MATISSLRPKLKPNGGVPAHLARTEGDLFAKIVRAYGLHDEVSRQILAEACTSLMRAREARETIDKEGVSFRDRWGQIKANPVCAIERDARAAALSALRQLNLELPHAKGSKDIDWGVT